MVLENAAMRPTIRYVKSRDGVRIAWTARGTGPLVVIAGCFAQIGRDWDHPGWRHLLGPIEARHRVLRFDERGQGLSDRAVEDVSLEARLADLEAVIEAHGAGRFALVGLSAGVSVAIPYAARHPERVSRLALYGGAVSSNHRYITPGSRAAMTELMRNNWGMASAALGEMLARGASPEETALSLEYTASLATGEMMARYMERNLEMDVREDLAKLDLPCVVLHRREDATMPFDNAREIVAGIPKARLIALGGSAHPPFMGDAGCLGAELAGFLDEADPAPAMPPPPRVDCLSARQTEVLRLLSAGRTNQEIAATLSVSVSTVDRHVANIYGKTGVHNRAEATLWAVAHGIVTPAAST